MNWTDAFTTQAALAAVAWALLHFVWQGALVAALYAAFSQAAAGAGANVRYAGACLALAVMLACPFVTAGLLLGRPAEATPARELVSAERRRAEAYRSARSLSGGPVGAGASAAAGSVEQSSSSSPQELREWAEERFAALVPWLVFAWLAGVLALASRAVGGLLVVLRLRRSARPVAEHVTELLARVSGRLRVSRTVRLCQSVLVEVPTVVGHLRPVILIPASALTGLTPAQLEAVLAHELAHVRRHDYVVNLLQTAAETLLFYHPAVWWVSRRARVEREHACDDAAVQATGDVLLYARALAELEQLRAACATTPALALAADGGSLMHRIQRLVRPRAAAKTRTPLTALALLLVTLCAGAVAARALVPADASEAPAAAPTSAPAQRREVAITFVNYPGSIYSAQRLTNKTRKLLRSLKANNAKAVAFVNDARIGADDPALAEARVQMLREWLDEGHELGNETAHHTSLYDAGLAEFKEEVIKGEQTIARLAAERGQRVRYFSYPYLNTGATLDVKRAAEEFLRGRGYEIHPVTIDNMDWLFSRAYIEALRREDEQAAARIRAEYVPYMERMFEFSESYAREVVGRDIPQVLMLTFGALNADAFDDLAAMMKRRGYTFVTMEQATKDEAYSLPDNYTGERGDSWLARWAVTKGLLYRDTEEVSLPGSMKQYLVEFQKMRAEKIRAEKEKAKADAKKQ
ncbi:MAG TPA: M56 family metallopeptidase [Pyrinomonadaceae bacterium]|nr:M56 family metallopeptidase [Pyrinomonadaceae bacterium]